jgi:hypothetical protein
MATMHVRKLDSNGDEMRGRGMANFHYGSRATAQRLECNLKVILGEWFLDANEGVPWYQDGTDVEPILGHMPANAAYAEATLKARILTTNGVASITSFDLVFDRNTRMVTINASGKDVDGDAWSVSDLYPLSP